MTTTPSKRDDVKGPERIYLFRCYSNTDFLWSREKIERTEEISPGPEYVRADLYDSLAEHCNNLQLKVWNLEQALSRFRTKGITYSFDSRAKAEQIVDEAVKQATPDMPVPELMRREIPVNKLWELYLHVVDKWKSVKEERDVLALKLGQMGYECKKALDDLDGTKEALYTEALERDRYRELLVRMHDDTILDKQDAEYYKRIIKVHREWITEAISPIPKLRQSLPHEWHSGCAYATPKKL